jgi:EAL domain-containing protein (putative c-di-GMP-specific phosphodiesterase class I)
LPISQATAEGVETEEQPAVLIAEHCTQVQGYLFSEARPVEDIPQLCNTFESSSRRAGSVR